MGQLTRLQLLDEGGARGGNQDINARSLFDLNAWLRSTYAAWPWPWLQTRASGISLPSGTQSLTVGKGSSGITLEIQRILDPIKVYNSSYSTKGVARIMQLTNSGEDWDDETLQNPATFRGLPGKFKIRSSGLWGQWNLIPLPFPDRDYLITFDYLKQPADLASDSDVPPYPNDETLIQVVQTAVTKYSNSPSHPDYLESLGILQSMYVADKVKYGQVPGTNDLLQLDPDTFR